MRGARPVLAPAGAAAAGAVEAGLAAAVVETLLREDYAGLSGYVRAAGDEAVLGLPGGRALPLRPDGFLADFAVARPAAVTLEDVESLLGAIAPAADAAGVAAFGTECRQALATLRLREAHLPAVRARLAGPGSWLGPAGSVRYDALAAARPHPAYPTAAARLGFADEDTLRYAPEFWPEFELNWVAVPRAAAVTARGQRPGWWPGPADVGLPGTLAGTHELMPVHPLTARRALPRALAEAGLAAEAAVAPGRRLRVRPTLSTRTVAVTAAPGTQLKLPLPVSTLGLGNRRALVPRTLADGSLVGEILAALADRDPELDGLLLADDGDFAHARHPSLGYLRRRLPAGLGQSRIVPVAALLAPVAGGLVIDELARAGGYGGPVAFFRAYLDLLFGVQVRLFARYGIALESHQQNAAVVAGPGSRLRLLVKDFDGALINHARLAGAAGGAPGPDAFGDPRLLTGSDEALADVFITITVHLCAGALAFGLARAGYAPRPELLGLVREALADALDRAGPAGRRLRARILEAERLPGKAMLTAGTLTDKARTGASDINKYYGPPGPNYLRRS